MTFDGVILYKVSKTMTKIQNESLRQVYQKDRWNFFFKFRSGMFQISLHPEWTFLVFRERFTPGTSDSSKFLQFLRSRLTGAVLRSIEQHGMDRILSLDFEKKTPFGEKEAYRLIVELMGPNSNIIVTGASGIILQSFKPRVTKNRTLLPGARYIFPDKNGVLITDLTKESLESLIKNYSGNIETAIIKNIQGISRKTIRKIFELFELNPGELESRNGSAIISLWKVFETLKKELENEDVYVIHRDDSSEISLLPDKRYPCEKESVNTAIMMVIESSRLHREIESKRALLLKKLQKEIGKLEKLRDKLLREKSQVEDYEDYRRRAELLTANLYRLNEKRETVVLEDWNTGEEIEIKLDSRFTPAQNAQSFFKYYEKAKRKIKQVEKRLDELEKKLGYFLDLKEILLLAEDEKDFDAVKEEMVHTGLIKESRKRNKKPPISGPRIFNINGWTYLIGRNNLQNDLLRKQAARNDIWFHARNIPGAHVILKVSGRKPSEREYLYGAALAARFSKARYSKKVEVDYTEVKNLWKPKGFALGRVLYRDFKTITVDPETLDVGEVKEE
ncbi:Rqc2 family fibronectin-binding protein [Kosmotoga olearia]|uniref:Fibronectin-binding A domain protein n=1 Tax=Kosmotoga olearia (strain ATCC BAA-1733 / DSM 21960 / TBF 19.5.1) TaxID=521045 RepID=C5CF09_KOSOT|nr:NFACT family protein [Kosmotoga olearia]ACR80278.1 Fibronectin-binding A domain protein [Kosmotoga olearia TBF 19.5.1]